MYTATYSPEDNKLRLYAGGRLDPETYQRVKAAGFHWAPKQNLFVAPMWTPEREDLLLELCDEVGDEDTSLVDRAEERAERFEDYSESRADDAEMARKSVASIADGIPFGQPILVGHHSERRARKDAEKIENGMRRAVKMWETSEYWKQRAAGAIRHAKYKELPGVRYRRIKGLEAEKRKCERSRDEVAHQLATWTKIAAVEDSEKRKTAAVLLAGHSRVWVKMPRKEGDRPDFDQSPSVYDCLTGSHPTLYAPRTVDEVVEHVLAALTRSTRPNNGTQRWIDHYENRIAYERAMLEETGGIKGASIEYEIGGRILRRGEWLLVTKINKRAGVVHSVTVIGHFASTVSVDEIRDYRPPQDGDAEKVKAAISTGPMCNYPGEGFKHMTTPEWKARKMSDVPQASYHKATETHGKHRTRATAAPRWSTVSVYLTDSKRIDPPGPDTEAPVKLERIREPRPVYTPTPEPAAASNFDAMRETLKQGIKVVSAPQLFPTPVDLAARMVELAGIEPGHSVLDPSAGTGRLLTGLPCVRPDGEVVAVEINPSLAQALEDSGHVDRMVRSDFLDCTPEGLGTFDRILMNPPFADGADIKHITHAISLLKPGGRLVAICANGPRQNERLRPLVEERGGTWEELPADTFKDAGTSVRTVLLVLDAPKLEELPAPATIAPQLAADAERAPQLSLF